MDEETLKLLTDLHINNHRQGPGGPYAFKRALDLSGIDTSADITIADIGSGTGSATIPLLKQTNASITAVELLPAFLEKLQSNAESEGVADRLQTIEADMAELPFEDEQFDAIWSEGAIYNIGFETGVQKWRRFLKPGAVLIASEITWLHSDIPDELKSYWKQAYPEIDVASNKLAVLEKNGYSPIGYFTLPPDCWLTEYYEPIQAGLTAFLKRNGNSKKAKEIAEADKQEYELYKKYKDYYSYGVYIAKKI
ncbi:class I SAM-dependent methyltransferase [Candidatus Kaiserbacteria bacterium]|nr:class I SAM-dependent methyltransferase [Candidatus Kaiserbacteria bacterium]